MMNRVTEYLPSGEAGQSVREASRPASPVAFSSQNIQQWIEPAEELIVKYPAAALASAFVIGVALAWWIKRT